MQFIYSIQNELPEGCPEKYFAIYPLTECNNIFKFLITFELEKLNEINLIHIYYKTELPEQYKSFFYNFSSDIEKYKDLPDIMEIKCNDIFEKKIAEIKKEKIERVQFLINRTRFFSQNQLSEIKNNNTQYLIYLPFANNTLKSIIKDIKNCEIVTNKESLNFSIPSQYYYIDKNDYIEIESTLDRIKESVNEVANTSYFSSFPPFIEIFGEELINQLRNFGRRKQVHIKGNDTFLVTKIIYHLVQPQIPTIYNLTTNIPQLIDNSTPVAFFNYDFIQNEPELCKQLYEAVNRSNEYYRILQSKNINPNSIYDRYFNSFVEFNLPEKEAIKNNITTIFLSFLIEQFKLTKEAYLSLLLIQNNTLFPLLKDITDLDMLYKITIKIKEIKPFDLINNIELWCLIKSEINKTNLEKQSVFEQKTKRQIYIKYEDSAWKIEGLGKIISLKDTKQNKNTALLYISLILESNLIKKRPIKSIDLYNRANEILERSDKIKSIEKSKDKYQTLEQCSNAIRNTINRISETSVEIFFDNNISFKNNSYYFDNLDNYEVTIIHPSIKVN